MSPQLALLSLYLWTGHLVPTSYGLVCAAPDLLVSILFYLLSFLHSKRNHSHASGDALLLLTIWNAVVHRLFPSVGVMEQLLMEKPVMGTVPSSSLSIHWVHVVWSGWLCPLTVNPSLHPGSVRPNHSTSTTRFCLPKIKEHFPPRTHSQPAELSTHIYQSMQERFPPHLGGFPDLL